jgi:hypothetical protein
MTENSRAWQVAHAQARTAVQESIERAAQTSHLLKKAQIREAISLGLFAKSREQIRRSREHLSAIALRNLYGTSGER